MARIRTIKPEFPQSESMGRVSRDARLLFVQLWTICDDEGRTRAASRMLASLLFPYDDDAPNLIDDWLAELEREDCIALYRINGTTYLQICNWLNHQKIDRASKSKFPEFDESSRIFASPREPSSVDRGPWTVDRGPRRGPRTEPSPPSADAPGGPPLLVDRDSSRTEDAPPSAPPTTELPGKESRGTRLPKPWSLPRPWGEWAMGEFQDLTADRVRKIAEQFRDYWHSKAGAAARKADWEAAWRNWVRKEVEGSPSPRSSPLQTKTQRAQSREESRRIASSTRLADYREACEAESRQRGQDDERTIEATSAPRSVG